MKEWKKKKKMEKKMKEIFFSRYFSFLYSEKNDRKYRD